MRGTEKQIISACGEPVVGRKEQKLFQSHAASFCPVASNEQAAKEAALEALNSRGLVDLTRLKSDSSSSLLPHCPFLFSSSFLPNDENE
jgi:hypothetical protein